MILEIITAVGSITTPLLALFFGNKIWRNQKSIERKIKLEENLRSDRIEIYNQILKPYILTFSNYDNKNTKFKRKSTTKEDEAVKIILSHEYRRTCCQLVLIGSDEVVTSYNGLMQHFYSVSDENQNSIKLMELLGDFLLAIRKSVGNDATTITNFGMLEWLIKDINNYVDNPETV